MQQAKSIHHDSLDAVVVKERKATITGDRPGMGVTRLVVSTQMRGIGRRIDHDGPTSKKEVGHPAV